MNRPKWARRLEFWVSDPMYDALFSERWARWPRIARFNENIGNRLEHLVEIPVRRLICALFGHEPDMDHRGRPEHDFCWSCNKPMPGMAPRRRAVDD